MGIPVKIYSVDSLWEQSIKDDSTLTQSEKRKIIFFAHLGAFVKTILSLIGSMILASILMGIIYLIFSLFK